MKGKWAIGVAALIALGVLLVVVTMHARSGRGPDSPSGQPANETAFHGGTPGLPPVAANVPPSGEGRQSGSAVHPNDPGNSSPDSTGSLRDMPVPFASDGRLPTDLSPDETQEAESIYMKQTELWKKLKRVTARITVRVTAGGNEPNQVQEVTGVLDLRVITGAASDPWQYEVQIRDPCDRWVFTALNIEETRLQCDDGAVRKNVEPVLDRNVAFMTCLPHLVLVPLFSSSQNSHTNVFRTLQPWRSREVQGLPQSYTFKDYRKGSLNAEPALLVAFQKGLLHAWEKRFETGRTRAVFSGYRPSDSFPFPPRIDMWSPLGTRREVILDNVNVVLD